MTAETSEMELDLLRRRADASNFYVNRHRDWDPTRGTGDLYLMRKKKFRNEHADTIARYATADEINAALSDIERTGEFHQWQNKKKSEPRNPVASISDDISHNDAWSRNSPRPSQPHPKRKSWSRRRSRRR